MKPKITFNRSVDSEILPSIIAKDVVKFDLKASSQGLGVAAVGLEWDGRRGHASFILALSLASYRAGNWFMSLCKPSFPV